MAASVTDAFRRCRRDVLTFARSGERRTMIEAGAVLLLVRIGLWMLPYAVLRSALERATQRVHHRPRVDSPSDVGRIVKTVARRLPMPMTCLVQALAAQAMLRRRGCDSTVEYGVRSGPAGGHALDSHAWLVSGGRVVVGEMDELNAYATLRHQLAREPDAESGG